MRASDDYVPPQRSVLERILIRSWEYRRLRFLAGLRIGAGFVLVGLGFVTLVGGSFTPKAVVWAAFFLVLAARSSRSATGTWLSTTARLRGGFVSWSGPGPTWWTTRP